MMSAAFIKRWLRRLLVVVAAILFLLAALALAAQTPPAKRALASLISGLVAEHTSLTLRIEEVTGTLPHNLRIGRMELADADGRLVTLHGIEMKLALTPLARRNIHLHTLIIEHVEVWRRPPPQERWRIPRLPQLPFHPTVAMLRVDRITLDEAVVGAPAALTVTGSVMPGIEKSADRKNDAGASLFALPEVALEVRGLDAQGVHGTLRYSVADGGPRLSLVVEDEQLLPVMLDVAPPVSARVEGSGTRADWRATLTAGTGDAAIADGALRLAEGDETTLNANLTANLTALPPLRQYTGMLGEVVALEVAGSLDRQGTLRISQATLGSDVVAVALNGAINLEEDTVDLELSLDYDDVGRFPGMPPRESEAPMQFRIAARGTFSAPEIMLTASVDGVETLDGAIQANINDVIAARGSVRLTPPPLLRDIAPMLPEDNSADITFDVAYTDETGVLEIADFTVQGMGVDASLRGKLTPELPALDVKASFAVEELSRLGALLPVPMSGAARVEIAAANDGDRLNATLTAEVASLDAGVAQLSRGRLDASAQWDNWRSSAPTNLQGSVEATTDALQVTGLKPLNLALSGAFDAPTLQEFRVASLTLTDGNLTVGGTGVVNLDAMTVEANVEALALSLAALPVDVEDLPDGELRLTATATGGIAPLSLVATLSGDLRNPGGVLAFAGSDITFDVGGTVSEERVEIAVLSVSGEAFTIDGETVFDRSSGAVQGELRAALPDVAVIGAAIDQPLAGAITVAITATGELPNLELNARVEGDGLTYGTGPPIQAHFDVVADEVPAKAAITVTGEASGGGETLSLELRAALDDAVIRISPLTVVSGANRISGQATWPLDTGMPEAQLDADLAELGALAALVGLDVRGRATAALRLRQDTAEVVATAHDLEYDEVSLEKVEARLEAGKLWDAPAGSLALDMFSLTAGPLNMKRIAVAAQGDLANIQLNVTVDGRVSGGVHGPHALTGLSAGNVSVAEQRIEITRFEGSFGAFPFALDGATTARITDAGFQLTPLTLRMGGGTARIEGQLDAASVYGAARFEAFPLDVSSLFVEPGITGRLNGSVTLAGTREAPEIEARLAVSEARIIHEDAESLVPMKASLYARVGGGRAEATLTAAMPDVATVNAEGSVPLVMQLQPWLLEAPATAPVSGNATWDVSFKPILEGRGMEEHYLDASLTGAFALSGTVGVPVVSGDAFIRDGHYENAVTGTRLRQINVHIHADGTTARLVQFAADTGSRGTLAATGEMQLQPSEGFPFSARVELNDAELAQLDYLNGRVNGVLTVEGGLDGVLVSGDLVVGPVNASMPDQRPVSEPIIIEVIEVVDGEVATPEAASRTRSLPAVNLDIRCSMPGRIYMRAPILDSEWGGNLHIRGLLTDPRVEGRIAVLRGHLDFLGRRFQLRDSAISFLGGAPTAPWLDMLAVAETPSLTARLNLTGDLSNVNLDLSSVPPMPQDEVLSHVLFGRDLSRISPVQAIQLARVAAMFNRGLAGMQLFSGVIVLPGIDRIDIRTGERADELVVGIGRYFTDSVYVEVEQGTTSDSGKISVEVEVSPQISIKGDVDATERSGLGVFWRRDY